MRSSVRPNLAKSRPASQKSWCGVQGYGSDLVVASLSLLEEAAAALDGERDPRCLLAGFSTIQSLATLYAQSGDAPAKVGAPGTTILAFHTLGTSVL